MAYKDINMLGVAYTTVTDSLYPTTLVSNQYGQILTITFAVLSILGTFAIILSYFLLPDLRNTVRQLLLTLATANSLIALTNIIGSLKDFHLTSKGPNGTVVVYNATLCGRPMYACIAYGYVNSTAYLVSYFYIVTIATYFYVVGVRGVHKGIHKRLVWVHIFCWAVPLLICTAALYAGALGPGIWMSTGPWCWVSSCGMTTTEEIFWMLMIDQGWLMIAYVVCPILYFFLWRDIRLNKKRLRLPFSSVNQNLANKPQTMFRSEDANFKYSPFILYFLRIWGTIRFVIIAIEISGTSISVPHTLTKFLGIMQCICDNLQGFGNFVLFCLLDATIMAKVYSCVGRCCCGKNNRSKYETITEQQVCGVPTLPADYGAPDVDTQTESCNKKI